MFDSTLDPIVGEETKRIPTSSISFRINTTQLNGLRQVASQQEIGLNTLVSQIFGQYLDWGRSAGKAGMVPVHKSLITLFLERFTEEDMKVLAEKMVEEQLKDVIGLIDPDESAKSFLKILETWLRVSGFRYRHEIDGKGKQTFVIQHDMGRKWSVHLAELFRLQFWKLGSKRTQFDITNNSLRFSIEL